MHLRIGRGSTDRDPLENDLAVATVQDPQCSRQCGLRLDGNDPGIQPAQARDTIPDMGADVEHEITGSHELAQQRIAPSPIGAVVALVQGASNA